MKTLKQQPGLTEQVYQSLLGEICGGKLVPGTHLVQEQLAADLGVSRQPIQQALAMLKNEGLLQELGRRGLFVAPLDLASMRHHYEIRAALDGLAARRAAERAAASPAIAHALAGDGAAKIAAGRGAVAKGNVAAMIQADVAFHSFVYAASGNPHLAPTAELHWRQLRRVMGEVLRHAGPPKTIWDQHARIIDAIAAGDPDRAEREAIAHVHQAAGRLEAVPVPAQPKPASAADPVSRRLRQPRFAGSS